MLGPWFIVIVLRQILYDSYASRVSLYWRDELSCYKCKEKSTTKIQYWLWLRVRAINRGNLQCDKIRQQWQAVDIEALQISCTGCMSLERKLWCLKTPSLKERALNWLWLVMHEFTWGGDRWKVLGTCSKYQMRKRELYIRVGTIYMHIPIDMSLKCFTLYQKMQIRCWSIYMW